MKQILGSVPPNYEFAYRSFSLDFKHSDVPVEDTASSGSIWKTEIVNHQYLSLYSLLS